MTLENLKRVIIAYEDSLLEAEALLDMELTQELRIDLLSRISDLQMNVLSNSNQVLVVEQKIETLKRDINTLNNTLGEQKADLARYTSIQAELRSSREVLMAEKEKLSKEDTTITVPVSASDVVKFAILGAVAGSFVVFGVAFVQYIMGKKLRRVDELKERYGMRVLGDFYAPSTKENMFDQMLDRMEGFQVPIDVEKEAALVAAKVQVLAPVDGDKWQIIVTGTIEGDMLESVAQQIGKYLPAAAYEISMVQNPVYDADALLAIRQGIVVLVEARDVSVKKEIALLVDILIAAKVKVLGVVLQ